MDNLVMKDGRYQELVIAAASSGDPKMIGQITAVAMTDRDSTTGKAVFDLGPGVVDLSVQAVNDVGNLAIAVGDRLFYNVADTPVLSKKSSGHFFGYALETVASGSTDTINVLRCAAVGIGAADFAEGGPVGNAITDPGDGGAIPIAASGFCAIETAAAETRSLALPSFVGQRLVVTLDVDGGDVVITASAAVNQAGNNTITMADAGDYIELVGVQKAGALVWRVAANDGATLSTV